MLLLIVRPRVAHLPRHGSESCGCDTPNGILVCSAGDLVSFATLSLTKSRAAVYTEIIPGPFAAGTDSGCNNRSASPIGGGQQTSLANSNGREVIGDHDYFHISFLTNLFTHPALLLAIPSLGNDIKAQQLFWSSLCFFSQPAQDATRLTGYDRQDGRLLTKRPRNPHCH